MDKRQPQPTANMDDKMLIPKFDGSDKVEFTWFRELLMAYGNMKDGFSDAYLNNLPTVDSNGNLLPDNVKKRNNAWGHLIMLLQGPPLYLV